MECPHCGIGIEMVEENCGIFRCGVFRDTFIQIPPHLSEPECLAIRPLIYGCGRPFQYRDGKLVKCAYI